MTNILIIYSRDIDINDSGGARTTIELANYISEKKYHNCYTLFGILDGNRGKINEIKNLKPSADTIHNMIIKYDINILLVPEAILLAKTAKDACKETNCKVVTALHNMPGYERLGLFALLKDAALYHENSIKRIRAYFLLALYPIVKIHKVISIKKNMRNAYYNSDKLVLLSETFYSSFEKVYNVPNSDKLTAIGNALSFSYFANIHDIKNKKKQILIVSRLNESQKRISIALKAWETLYKKYPDWELVIVGFGRSEISYKKYVDKKNIKRVYFTGKKQPEPYYKDSSIFLMTSAYEGWGMTLTEAQQYGCVPIAMNSYASLTDIITNNYNGIISPNNDIDEYIVNIEHLINNASLREELAINAVESSKRFTKEKISEKWITLFNSIVK